MTRVAHVPLAFDLVITIVRACPRKRVASPVLLHCDIGSPVCCQLSAFSTVNWLQTTAF